MVNRRRVIRGILVIAILLALVYQGWISLRSIGAFEDGENAVPVLIADRYIPAFSAVKPKWVRLQNYPRGLVSPGTLQSARELSDAAGAPTFVSAVAIPRGQPLTRALLIDSRKSQGLASMLRPGKVAVSFAVDRVRGVGGWIQPGDTIAVFQSGALDPRAAGGARLLFRALNVLAVDKTRLGQNATASEPSSETAAILAASEESGAVVTVLMNILEAGRLIEAGEQGRLTAVLRAWGDELMEDSHAG